MSHRLQPRHLLDYNLLKAQLGKDLLRAHPLGFDFLQAVALMAWVPSKLLARDHLHSSPPGPLPGATHNVADGSISTGKRMREKEGTSKKEVNLSAEVTSHHFAYSID